MRITDKMMVDNAKYWISKQAERLNEAETVSASGKQVNKPSDDPAAAAQILEYRSAVSKYNQYQSNVSEANTWVEAGEDVLDSVDSLLGEAVDIASGDQLSESDTTETYLETLKSIYQQIIGLANTKCSSSYMYGGSQPDSIPFSDGISIDSGNADGIGFYLTSDASDVTITISDSSENVVRTLTGSGTEGSNTITWDGCDDSGNALPDGDYTFTVSALDASGESVASSCYQGDDGTKTITAGSASTITLNTNGGDIFSTALSAINQLVTAIESGTSGDNSLSDAEDSLNSAIDKIKSERVALANIYSVLGISSDRLDKLSTLAEQKLSDVETGSTEEASANLSAQQTAYETTIEAAAKILKMSKLSDYI
jgi:flagellar hook-associated protein 3